MIRHQPFQIQMQQTARGMVLTLSGAFDENAKMPQLPSVGGSLIVKLAGVSTLNSAGTRSWMVWVNQLPKNVQVYLEECPVVFVRSMNLVRGFLTPNTTVMSFYIPYYSDGTGERKDILARRGTEFSNDGSLKLTAPKDAEGQVMVMDVLPDSYLAFLR